jgi:hypothetical protein
MTGSAICESGCKAKIRDIAEPVIGRAFARPVGSSGRHNPPFIVGDRRITLRSAPRARPAGDWR